MNNSNLVYKKYWIKRFTEKPQTNKIYYLCEERSLLLRLLLRTIAETSRNTEENNFFMSFFYEVSMLQVKIDKRNNWKNHTFLPEIHPRRHLLNKSLKKNFFFEQGWISAVSEIVKRLLLISTGLNWEFPTGTFLRNILKRLLSVTYILRKTF